MTEPHKNTLYHISSHEGMLHAVHRLFHVIQQKYGPSHRIGYFNNNTLGVLAQALRESTAPWVKDPQRMMQFEYERVLDIFDLLDRLQAATYDVVVVEHVDAIMQEHTAAEYPRQNLALSHLMAVPTNLVLIDTWEYLDTYYFRQKI